MRPCAKAPPKNWFFSGRAGGGGPAQTLIERYFYWTSSGLYKGLKPWGYGSQMGPKKGCGVSHTCTYAGMARGKRTCFAASGGAQNTPAAAGAFGCNAVSPGAGSASTRRSVERGGGSWGGGGWGSGGVWRKGGQGFGIAEPRSCLQPVCYHHQLFAIGTTFPALHTANVRAPVAHKLGAGKIWGILKHWYNGTQSPKKPLF